MPAANGCGGEVGIAPMLPLSYGSPTATFPICPDTGSRPAASLCVASSPKMALEAAVVILVTASMLAAALPETRAVVRECE